MGRVRGVMAPVPLSVCVCVCGSVRVGPLIKLDSGLVIKMHYHPTVKRGDKYISCLLSLILLFYILTDSIFSRVCGMLL